MSLRDLLLQAIENAGREEDVLDFKGLQDDRLISIRGDKKIRDMVVHPIFNTESVSAWEDLKTHFSKQSINTTGMKSVKIGWVVLKKDN